MKKIVNDIHSKLNSTAVDEIYYPTQQQEIVDLVKMAKRKSKKIIVCGGRGSMGGQQFLENGILVDLTRFNRVLEFKGTSVKVESGIDWPTLHSELIKIQASNQKQMSFRQKQTGADFFTVGGSLSTNIHGRGLQFPPLISDVMGFHILLFDGSILFCSRTENSELFSLAIGGYGLFGIILDVELKLYPRIKLRRDVEIVDLDELPVLASQRVQAGYQYGDFQFSTDEKSENFLKRGVCATYLPVDENTPIDENPAELGEEHWAKLYTLAHTDRKTLYKMYTDFYLSTAGQIYWSDTHQMSVYLKNYHSEVDQNLGVSVIGSEMISEIYVTHEKFKEFMGKVREDFVKHQTPLIYGTVRLIKKDTESFLSWAKEDYACIVFNLHVDHSERGIAFAQENFRRLIDRGLELGGSFYLTYHRWATQKQIETAYPRFREFLTKKVEYDPLEIFYSNWYGHYKKMFSS